MLDPGGQVPPVETHYRTIPIRAAGDLHALCMQVVQSLRLGPGARVLDLGAGEGALSQRLIDAGFDVHAVELVPGRHRSSAPCNQMDLNRPFAELSGQLFELVVAIEVIEHLENPRHFIRECLRVVSPRGHLLVTSPNVHSWYSRIHFLRTGHLTWFDEKDYVESGHITPIFSWQMSQIARELGAEVVNRWNTSDALLWARLGDTWTSKLKRKSFYMSALYPFMRSEKSGEINVFLLRRHVSPQSSGEHLGAGA